MIHDELNTGWFGSVIGRPYYWAWSGQNHEYASSVEPTVVAGMEDKVVTDIGSSKKFIAMIAGTNGALE